MSQDLVIENTTEWTGTIDNNIYTNMWKEEKKLTYMNKQLFLWH